MDTHPSICVEGTRIAWRPEDGACTFEGLPVAVMWVDSTLAGLMAGVQTMVGTERFLLALQSEGRKSVEEDWQVISTFPDFRDGFAAIARIAAVAGWGRWELVSCDDTSRTCVFRVYGCWESRYQATLGVGWGSAMLAGKMAGYCSKLFETNCWADQTAFEASGDAYDEFVVSPSARSVEEAIDGLLVSGEATRADMAVALQKLQREIEVRHAAEGALREAHDKLELRVAERTAELAASEEKFRHVIDSSPMGVLTYRLDGDTLILTGGNPAADRILGIEVATLVGRSIEEAFPDLVHTDVPEHYRTICRSGGSWHNDEVRYDDGIIKGAYDVYAFPTSPGAMAVMFMDTTERRRIEQDRAHLAEQLHRSRRMEALGLLAGGVAHDLNNILSGIVGYPDLLLEGLPPDSPLREPLECMRESGRRAAAVVKDLLTMTRGTAAHWEVVSLNHLVADGLRSPELLALGRDRPAITLVKHLDDATANVKCSRVHIEKLLMNLLTNAYEAIPDEGVITVATSNCYVEQPLPLYDRVEPGQYAVLSVTDSGPGMGDADIERIFEPFYSRKILGRSGTGLGLTLVWNTVQEHGGYVDVVSSSEGTHFDVYLPACHETATVSVETDKTDALRGRGERILVIDDEALQRTVACRMLTQLGYKTEAVASGEEALALVQDREVDLLLLDMIMPGGIGGRETYAGIVKHRPGQRAIIVSGYAHTEEVTAAQALGAGAFLPKPYSLRELGQAVKAALDAV